MSLRRRFTAPLILLVMLAQGACAGRNRASMDVLTMGAATGNRGCQAAPAPANLPEVDAVLQPERLQPALEDAAPARRGALLASVRFAPDGHVAAVRLLETTLPGPEAEQLTAAIRGAIVPTTALADATLRVLVERLDSMTVRVGRSEYCPPKLMSAPPIAAQASIPSAQVASVGQPRFLVLVDERGSVVRHRLLEGSGLPQLDAAAARSASQARFQPARVDGETRQAWTEYPER